MLNCEINSGMIYIDVSSDYQIMLPRIQNYFEKHADKVTDQDVQQVESLHN